MEELLESLSENVSEECFNEIVGIVEEIISERNKENREAKRKWEMSRGAYSENPVQPNDSKENAIKQGERVIKHFQKHIGSKDPHYILNQSTVDQMAKGNRLILGRHQNPVSIGEPSQFNKVHSKKTRTKESQRSSVKDPYAINNDPLKVSNSIIKNRINNK